MRRLVLVLFVMLLGAGAIPYASAADGCGPLDYQCQQDKPAAHNDDAHDTVVTDAVLFPHTSSDSALGQATATNAGCTDCEWRRSPMCMQNGPTDDAMCLNAATACPPPDIYYRIYLRHGTGPWQFIDTICLGPGERPVPASDVGDKVREVVLTYLPDAAPSFQPAQGGLVNLPTIFAAGEPEHMTTDPFRVMGFTVVVSATAHWDWTFEPGATLGFDKAGGEYPNDDVSYTYASPGERGVSLTTTWDATFTIDGAGPYPVPGAAITKTVGPMPVPVRESHSQLVGG